MATYHCNTCGFEKVFKTLFAFEQHKSDAHKILIPTNCYVCGKRYASKARMLQHISMHSNVHLKCITCDKVCVNMSGLIRHAEVAHNLEDPITKAVYLEEKKAEETRNGDFVLHPKTGLLFKMPKNPEVVGYQDDKGKFHAGEGVVLPSDKMDAVHREGICLINVVEPKTVFVSRAFIMLN